ncbi:MAG: hypothetical protein J2P30_18710 [Actinobacteria bacterium]|nr:hypothetical protein [Actinomycetota bacterium]
MSHHFDTPTAIADGRINLRDFYVFPATPGSTAVILTVNPDAAQKVMAAFLPDVVRYRPGAPAVFEPGGGNGRALGDDGFDIAVQFLAGHRLGNASTPRPATPEFPYLSPPQPTDLPALADLFGLRGQRSEQTPSASRHVA